VIDNELLPYHRFGLGKYEVLGEVQAAIIW
jgi:hypothetical protein